jgi:hypothetical protein
MALAGLLAGAAERDTLVEGDMVADDRRFADHNSHTMVDEEATADLSAGMDFDAGDKAAEL